MIPGTAVTYIVHLSNVAMEILIASKHTDEFDLGLALQVSLLHDILEDTNTTKKELENNFGLIIAECVVTLTREFAYRRQTNV